jgi:hypothetical protein
MTKRRIPLPSIDELLVHRFVTEHLPACKCSSPCQRNLSGVRPALAHLLYVLRGEGRISEPQTLVPQTIQDELDRFSAHLDAVCELASATRISRRMWVGKFLVDRFGSTPIEIDRIQPADIVEFMVRPRNRYSPKTAGVPGSTLRSYLRYRAVSCEDRVENLMAAVPTVARWPLATVPAHLTSDEMARFLGAFDRDSVSGQRGYAPGDNGRRPMSKSPVLLMTVSIRSARAS